MTKLQRVKEIVFGLIMIFLAYVMICFPKEGYEFIIFIFAVYFTAAGIRTIIYYVTMARYMVGGRSSLYNGVILLDLGLLTLELTNVPHYYVLVYLIAIHAFSGAVEVLRALEAKRFGGSWKLKIGHGVVNIILALICVVFIKYTDLAVVIYCIGLIYSSLLRIISACRRTKFVYIQ